MSSGTRWLWNEMGREVHQVPYRMDSDKISAMIGLYRSKNAVELDGYYRFRFRLCAVLIVKIRKTRLVRLEPFGMIY